MLFRSVDEEVEALAARLVAEGGFPPKSEVDALHVAIAAIHAINFLLTWNCRHINNADKKPLIRIICSRAGYTCPEICTPSELLSEEVSHVSG